MVTLEIIGFYEREYPSASLIADRSQFCCILGLGKQDTRAASRWANDEPALARCQQRIFT